jgi:DmpG-like communication domain
MSRPADDPATAIHRPLGDRAGNRGVYSSFLLHAERAAERYEIPAHAICSGSARLATSAGRRT